MSIRCDKCFYNITEAEALGYFSVEELYASESKENLREVNNEDTCPVCLTTFQDLKQQHGKKVLQMQCCGQIICQDDMVHLVRNWNGRPHENGERFKCCHCNHHPAQVYAVS